jgi:hypothetical protein
MSHEARAREIGLTDEMRECVRSCSECYATCTELFSYCLGRGGAFADVALIRLLIDCAEICQVTQNAMTRASELSPLLSAVTAESCERCADLCERFDDPQLADGAATCRACAECCHSLALA